MLKNSYVIIKKKKLICYHAKKLLTFICYNYMKRWHLGSRSEYQTLFSLA